MKLKRIPQINVQGSQVMASNLLLVPYLTLFKVNTIILNFLNFLLSITLIFILCVDSLDLILNLGLNLLFGSINLGVDSFNSSVRAILHVFGVDSFDILFGGINLDVGSLNFSFDNFNLGLNLFLQMLWEFIAILSVIPATILFATSAIITWVDGKVITGAPVVGTSPSITLSKVKLVSKSITTSVNGL